MLSNTSKESLPPVLYKSYAIDTPDIYTLDLTALSDGSLVFFNQNNLWLVEKTSPTSFKLTASLKISIEHCVKPLFGSCVGYIERDKDNHKFAWIWDPKHSLILNSQLKLTDQTICNESIKDVLAIADTVSKTQYIMINYSKNLLLYDLTQLQSKTLSVHDNSSPLDVSVSPNNQFAFNRPKPRSFGYENMFCGRQIQNGELKNTWEIERFFSPETRIDWVSNQYFLATGFDKFMRLCDKNKIYDNYPISASLPVVYPVKNSNFFFLYDNSHLSLYEVRSEKIHCLRSIPKRLTDRQQYYFTMLPNGDVAAILAQTQIPVPWQGEYKYAHYLQFYRFPELKDYRAKFNYNLGLIQALLCKKGLPREISKEVMEYLPEYQFFKNRERFGLFGISKSKQNTNFFEPAVKLTKV